MVLRLTKCSSAEFSVLKKKKDLEDREANDHLAEAFHNRDERTNKEDRDDLHKDTMICADILPFVTQLCLENPLVVNSVLHVL